MAGRAGWRLISLVIAGAAVVGMSACRPTQYTSESIEIATSSKAVTAENVAEIAELRSLYVSENPVVGGDFSPATVELLTVLDSGGLVQTWNTQTGEMLEEVYQHVGSGLAVAYSPDGRRLITGGKSTGLDIKIWDTTAITETGAVAMTGYNAHDASWAPDGEQFAIVSRGASRVFIYNSDATDHTQRRMSNLWLSAVAYGNGYLAIANDIGVIYLFRQEGYDFARELRHARRFRVRDLAFSPDERLLAGCFVDGTVEIWNTADWSQVSAATPHPPGTSVVAGCRDGEFAVGNDVFFSVGDDGSLVATNPQTGEEMKRIGYDSDVLTVSVSADGSLLAIGLEDGTVRILGLPS